MSQSLFENKFHMQIHDLVRKIGDTNITVESTVERLSNGVYRTLKQCNTARLKDIIQHLIAVERERNQKMRSAVVAELCTIGHVDADNKPDYDRINAYVANIGSNNPSKVNLYKLTHPELVAVLSQTRKMVAKEQKKKFV